MRILYLDLDALTPSHLSCYGYERRTSPVIDRIASEGVRFTNVYASDAPCLPSRTAFYSGRLGIQTGVVGHGGTAADPKVQGPDRLFRDHYGEQGLAQQMQRAGMHTAMISPFGQRHAAHHFYAGFNEIHNTGKNGNEDVLDVDPVVHKWLDDHASRDDWYLHINFWDIHTPYRAPASYGNPFEGEALPDWMHEHLDRWQHKTGPHTAMDPGMYRDAGNERHPRVPERIDSADRLKQWIDGYDTAIRYVDEAIGRIIEKLKAAGVYEETAIIISADHGENQGELGIYGEHGTADQGTCNIPMIVKWPGGAAGKVEDGLHYNLDWAPTLMDLLGREKMPIWDGVSYAEAVRRGVAAGREDLVISQCCHVCQRSVRWDKWLYIQTFHDGFHLFPREMLFDLEADPKEQHNIADDHPEVCGEGARRYVKWHGEQMWKMSQWASDVVDPMWTVIREGGPHHANLGGSGEPGTREKFERYMKRLEETGRADGAAALREKYPGLVGQAARA